MRAPGKYKISRVWFEQSVYTYPHVDGTTHVGFKQMPNGDPLPFSMHFALGTVPYFPGPEVQPCPN